MKFILQITTAPYQSQSSITAYHFAQAALNLGHSICQVFMFMDGVYHLLDNPELPADEFNVCQRWRELATEHDIEMLACVNSATKRGIESGDGFKIVSYAYFVKGVLMADRLVQF